MPVPGRRRDRAQSMAGLLSAEHTGQVKADDRIEREREFSEGRLSILFCSPTMELGVDIKDLSAVHMRNIPPTPANYAQRSGRAGRGGKPALVLAFSSHGNAHDHFFFRNKTRMIAGAVAPPRLDLANKELFEAHLHSVWLSIVGLNLQSSVSDVLDLDNPEFPLEAGIAAQARLSEERFDELLSAFRDVASAAGGAFEEAPWFSDHWLEDVARRAPMEFDAAYNRWRDLYRAATQQRDAARRKIDAPRASRKDIEAAKQQEREALREIELLLNRGSRTESDFYVYRYLANEGFMPGYNFPRLPLRAFVSTGKEAHAIDRPRFLGLSEFGPGNVVYHEGRKHRVAACVVPAGGIEGRLTRAKLCLSCGYAHPRDEATVDLCLHCGTRLDGQTSDFPQALFDQPTVRTIRWLRISSEEEERVREGYVVSTHFRISPGAEPKRMAVVAEVDNAPVLQATYVPQAELWRINHGWRRSAEQNGFVIDSDSGLWRRRDDAGDGHDSAGQPAGTLLTGLKPYVTDSRNILLLRPVSDDATNDAFLRSLAYALRRAMQLIYQVEEQEVAVDVIGREENKRLLFWEAAEGGIGVWERLVQAPRGFSDLAEHALDITHFDPISGAERDGWAERCTAACYDCLLSYSNQLDHRLLDRHLISDYLLRLRQSKLAPPEDGRRYDEQYRWL